MIHQVDEGLVRVCFEYDGGTELLWAIPESSKRVCLDNSPFFVYGVSRGDLVAVEPDAHDPARVVFQSVVKRGGHSTYRLYTESVFAPDRDPFKSRWTPLDAQGCTFEGVRGFLLSVDVPPGADIHEVYAALVAGENAGVWEFEEAHCGHPTDSS